MMAQIGGIGCGIDGMRLFLTDILANSDVFQFPTLKSTGK
jgi:lysyl-tRNA synthetase class II